MSDNAGYAELCAEYDRVSASARARLMAHRGELIRAGVDPAELLVPLPSPRCDGLCVDSADIGVPGYGIVYPHPGCPLHAPGERCGCDNPQCASPTHDWLPDDA